MQKQRKPPAWKRKQLEANMTTTEGYREWTCWTMLEETLQDHVLRLAGLRGWELAYHTHDSRRSASGFPDLVLASESRGRVLYMELKAEGEKPSPAQLGWGRVLTACGQEHHFLQPSDLESGRIGGILL